MRAIISDVHGNLTALEAVLRSISSQGVDEIWCLGDLVGYGPDPRECIDLVRKNCAMCLMGNHDWAVVNAPVGFNAVATRMIYKTKEWMEITEGAGELERKRWDYLSSLAMRWTEGKFVFVHASPRAELSEYILPGDVRYAPNKLHDIFGALEGHCVVGHTHMPCVITEDLELTVPHGSGTIIELSDKRSIINVGSVGQPRDRDNRACYVTVEDGAVTYHRVPYRFGKTMEKLAMGPQFEVLAYRLALGR